MGKVQIKKRSISIGVKIALLIAIMIIATCSLLGFFTYRLSSESLNENINISLEYRIKDNTKIIAQTIDSHLQEIEAIADRYVMKEMVWESQKQALIEESQKRSHYIKLGVADTLGNLSFIGGGNTNISDRDYFKKAISGNANISEPFINNTDGRMVITVVAPITNDNNKVIGVVMGGLDYKELISIDDIKLGNTGYAYILGKDGTTIAHPNDELVLNQDNTIKASSDDPNLVPLAKLEEKMVKRETGIGTYEYDGVEKFMAYAPIEGTEWSMALTQEKDEVFSGINLMKKYIFIITVIFIILGIIFGIGISRMITLPLLKMNQYTGELAQGNLSKKLNFNRNDELGETASALNIAVEAIKELIQKAKQLALLSRESSESITASTEEVSAASEEIASTIEQMAAGASDQAKNAEASAELAHFLEQKINIINGMLDESLKNSKAMIEKNQSGILLVEDFKKTFAKTSKASGLVSKSVEAVAEKSQAINSIIDTINAIADQTNLLALNAAIEAARAGEQGRGFAVVAEEVRKLAEESLNSTENITTIIDEIKQVITKAKTAVEDAENLYKESSSSVDKTVKVFEEIEAAVEGTIDRVEKISKTMEEVTKARDEVIEAAENISAVSQESAAGTQEVSASAQEQAASMEEVTATIEELNEFIKQLNDSIEVFKL